MENESASSTNVGGENESVEEEFLMVASIPAISESIFFSDTNKSKVQFQNLIHGSSTMKLDDEFLFQGQVSPELGTKVFFKKDDNADSNVKLCGHTTKVIKFKASGKK